MDAESSEKVIGRDEFVELNKMVFNQYEDLIDWSKELKNADGCEVYRLSGGLSPDPTIRHVSTFTEENRNDTYVDYWVYKNTGMPVNNSLSVDFRVLNR